MIKYIYFISFISICGTSLFGQTSETNRILENISQHNPQLKAYQAYIKEQNLMNKTENNLDNPEVSAFYLPFGLHNTQDYQEYQVSQRFEFPSIYGMRDKKIQQQQQILELNYKQLRQDVLTKTKKELVALQHLQKRQDLERQRLQTAERVHRKVGQCFEQGKIDRLEFNKSKLVWMQQQFKLEKLVVEKDRLLKNLQKLNGGRPLKIGRLVLFENTQPLSQEELWKEKRQMAPALKRLRAKEALAQKQVQLQKQKWLPDIVIGYNYQGVPSSYYHGFVGGLSLPLWNNNHKVEAAKAELTHAQSQTEAEAAEFYTNFQQTFQQYLLILEKYRAYRETLNDMNATEQLLNDFQKGKLSFKDYHGELEFYHQAYDDQLVMEKELHQIRAELLSHRL